MKARMAMCKDCIHSDVCNNTYLKLTLCEYGECKHFKDKSRYVELPKKALKKGII